MNRLRIVHDNAADRCSSLVASSTAGSAVVANLLTDRKGEPHRATGTSVTYTLTWTVGELIGLVCLAFANFTSTTTMRVRAYTLAADALPAHDSGAVLACAYTPLTLWSWGTVPLGVNAFSYGGAAYGRVYIPIDSYEKIVVDVVDVDQPSGHVEASRLIAGAWWAPERNPAWGASVGVDDTTVNTRSQSGDLRSDIGTISRFIPLSLEWVVPADRNKLWNILRGSARSGPIFLSVYPEDDDPEKEQMHEVWGKLKSALTISNPMYGVFSAPLEVEEI